MSMPSFVAGVPEISRENAINQNIAAIALEELALSHVINAEGEKIQYVLGTLVVPDRGLSGGITIAGLVNLDTSVASVLQAAAASMVALTEKLRIALAADVTEEAALAE